MPPAFQFPHRPGKRCLPISVRAVGRKDFTEDYYWDPVIFLPSLAKEAQGILLHTVETETETQRERETETDRQTDRQRQTDRDRERKRDRHRERQREREQKVNSEVCGSFLAELIADLQRQEFPFSLNVSATAPSLIHIFVRAEIFGGGRKSKLRILSAFFLVLRILERVGSSS